MLLLVPTVIDASGDAASFLIPESMNPIRAHQKSTVVQVQGGEVPCQLDTLKIKIMMPKTKVQGGEVPCQLKPQQSFRNNQILCIIPDF